MTAVGINRDATARFYQAVAEDREKWGSHGLPRASSIGSDLRQQWFELMHEKYPDDPQYIPSLITGEAYWRMDEGKWQEPEVYDILRKQGYLVSQVQGSAVRYLDPAGQVQSLVVPDESYLKLEVARLKREDGVTPLVTMHIDGVITGGPDDLPPTLLELKKITMFSYSGCVQNGIFAEKRQYYLQSQVCAQSFGLAGVRMMVFSKDPSATSWLFTTMRSKNPIHENPGLYIEDMRIDPTAVTLADARARHVLECVEREEPPVTDPGIDVRNAKILRNGETQRVFPCSHCDYLVPCEQRYWRDGVDPKQWIVVEDNRLKKDREETPNAPVS